MTRNSHVEPMMQGLLNAISSPPRPRSVIEHTLDGNDDTENYRPLTAMDRERLRTAAKCLTEFFPQMSSKTGCDSLYRATKILVDEGFEI